MTNSESTSEFSKKELYQNIGKALKKSNKKQRDEIIKNLVPSYETENSEDSPKQNKDAHTNNLQNLNANSKALLNARDNQN